jgi:exonuclease III
VRIVGWNIRAGGGRRIERIARAVAKWAPDAVALSEFRDTPPSRALADMLSQQGLGYQLTSSDCQERARNALLVASRWPLRRVAPTLESKEPAEPCRWLPVEIDAPERFILGAMHVPNRVTKRKYPFLDALLQQAARWQDSQAILIGDTNSGVPGIDEESPAFNGVEGRWMGAMEVAGWRDAFRAHAGRRRAYTWYSPNGDNGFRLDQAFLSPSMADRLVRAKHEWAGGSRRSGVSDHANLIVDVQ